MIWLWQTTNTNIRWRWISCLSMHPAAAAPTCTMCVHFECVRHQMHTHNKHTASVGGRLIVRVLLPSKRHSAVCCASSLLSNRSPSPERLNFSHRHTHTTTHPPEAPCPPLTGMCSQSSAPLSVWREGDKETKRKRGMELYVDDMRVWFSHRLRQCR